MVTRVSLVLVLILSQGWTERPAASATGFSEIHEPAGSQGDSLRALHPATLRYTGFLHVCPYRLGRTTYTGVKGSVHTGSLVRHCLIPWLALTTHLLCSQDFYEEENKLVRLWEKEEDGKSTFKFKLEVTPSNWQDLIRTQM